MCIRVGLPADAHAGLHVQDENRYADRAECALAHRDCAHPQVLMWDRAQAVNRLRAFLTGYFSALELAAA